MSFLQTSTQHYNHLVSHPHGLILISMKFFIKEKLDIFLVNVTILEGRHYAWPSMDSYVHIKVGNNKNCTRIHKSTDCPYYNEVFVKILLPKVKRSLQYFVFEFKTELQTLLDKSITLTVK